MFYVEHSKKCANKSRKSKINLFLILVNRQPLKYIVGMMINEKVDDVVRHINALQDWLARTLPKRGSERPAARRRIESAYEELRYLSAKVRVYRCLSGRVSNPSPGPVPGVPFEFYRPV